MEAILLPTITAFVTILAILFFASAAYSDIRTLRIPNAISIAVAVLGLLRILLLWLLFSDPVTALYTIASAVIVFLIGIVLFARRFIGGGDVKLLTATVLVVGCHDLFLFFMIMSICGALLAIVMLTLKHSFLPAYLGPRFAAFAATTKTMVPYGVAIGIAGSVTLVAQNTALLVFQPNLW